MNRHDIRVALRADASVRIGAGHVVRCVSLARALLKVGADVRLVSRNLSEELVSSARASEVEYVALPAAANLVAGEDIVPHAAWAGVPWQQDADETVAALAKWRPTWVIVDHYAFDARWHRQVSAQLGARIGVIDDLADRDLEAELIVDHNLSPNHQEKYRARMSARASVLGGPRFALLGPAFAGARRFEVADAVRSIGIFMGGVDAPDLSSVALRACRKRAGFGGKVEIVRTSAYPHARELDALAREWPDTAVLSDLPNLADFFSRHDLQIGAGGGASWERCCVGAPTLAVKAAANQDVVLPALRDVGAIRLVDGTDGPLEERIAEALRALLGDAGARRHLSERSQQIVDGRGAERVALWLTAGSLKVRPAALADSNNMYRWRNHPSTRSVSLSSGEITRSAHEQWLAGSLQNPARHLLVGHVGAQDVGVVRFDVRSDGAAEVSLYLDPALHGLRLGPAMLRAGESWMLSRSPPAVKVVATVLPENRGSIRMFESCGYRLEEGVWKKTVGPDSGSS